MQLTHWVAAAALLLASLAACAEAAARAPGIQVFLHHPRGSNNKLIEPEISTRNTSRLFRSGTDPRGGYHQAPTPSYLAGSVMHIEYTADGAPPDKAVHVLQYLCGADVSDNQHETQLWFDGTCPMDADAGWECSMERQAWPWSASPWQLIEAKRSRATPHDYSPLTFWTLAWRIPDELAGETCVVRVRVNDRGSVYQDRSHAFHVVAPDLVDLAPVGDTAAQRASGSTNQGRGYDYDMDEAEYGDDDDDGDGGDSDDSDATGSADDPGAVVSDDDVVPALLSSCHGDIVTVSVTGRELDVAKTLPENIGVPYTFVPRLVQIPRGGCVHFHWTGSDWNPDPDPDYNDTQGQQCLPYRDRFNLVQLRDNNYHEQWPAIWRTQSMFTTRRVWRRFAIADTPLAADPDLQTDGPALFPGMVVRFDTPGVWNFASTRGGHDAEGRPVMRATLIVGDGARVASPGVFTCKPRDQPDDPAADTLARRMPAAVLLGGIGIGVLMAAAVVYQGAVAVLNTPRFVVFWFLRR